jgi:hypothetical protein
MREKAIASRGTPFPFVDDYLYALRNTSSDQATLDRKYDIRAALDMFANLAPAAPSD